MLFCMCWEYLHMYRYGIGKYSKDSGLIDIKYEKAEVHVYRHLPRITRTNTQS
jgi:hypothetical protein